MAKKALVTGRTQNRTALGIIAAYLEMYPSTTLNELKQIFAKSSVCPDAGIGELFYTTKDLEAEKKQEMNGLKKTKLALLKMVNG